MNTHAVPSFSVRNRLERLLFRCVWFAVAAWTPPPLHIWRCFLLRLFGADIGARVRIYGSTRVWLPRNLKVQPDACIGPNVQLYNQGLITIGENVTVSQGAHLCTGTHDFRDPAFKLVTREISVGRYVWVAAEAFVGPGVKIGEGAVLGARTVAARDLDQWTVYAGNPARPVGKRNPFHD